MTFRACAGADGSVPTRPPSLCFLEVLRCFYGPCFSRFAYPSSQKSPLLLVGRRYRPQVGWAGRGGAVMAAPWEKMGVTREAVDGDITGLVRPEGRKSVVY